MRVCAGDRFPRPETRDACIVVATDLLSYILQDTIRRWREGVDAACRTLFYNQQSRK